MSVALTLTLTQLTLTVSGCGGAGQRSSDSDSITSLAREVAGSAEIRRARVITLYLTYGPNDLFRLGELPLNSYRVHLIDVGTGLAILVQGKDFTLLYDGGSLDDRVDSGGDHTHNRLISYLWSALGPSGPKRCYPEGDGWQRPKSHERRVIDHVILSHPDGDHSNMLDDVLECYRVKNVWDVGPASGRAGGDDYLRFWEAIAAEPDVAIHTVRNAPGGRRLRFLHRWLVIPPGVSWTTFGEGMVQPLGDGAEFEVLYARGDDFPDSNQNSLVLRVNLAGTHLLLMGDAEDGPRNSPLAPAQGVEAYLLDRRPDALRADILQVSQHGSATGSRREFLRAVRPRYALVSAGPTLQYGEPLPHPLVISALESIDAVVLRTDTHDEDGCVVYDKFGVNRSGPGGCDNFVLELGPARQVERALLPSLRH
jgi:competence protein ComEC